MQADATVKDHRESFLLGQPFWLAEGPDTAPCWELAIREDEPAIEGLEPALRPAPEEVAPGRKPASWKRLADRSDLVRFAVSDDPAWRHVALVCGAGLGKTTNLKWLEAAVNGLKNGCERPLAFALDLEQLPDNREALLQLLVGNIMDRVEAEEAKVRHRLRRLLAAGRVTFLLDSLDQSDPNPKGPVVAALRKLVEGVWRRCRVWISGRPYAFRTARPALQSLVPNLNWRFLRIGQLDEPECRQLLETAKPPGSR